MEGLLGKKIGMTQIYNDQGRAIPVTVLEVGPCVVVQRKTESTDGYEAAQIGMIEGRAPKKVTSARQGHFKKAGVAATRRLVEVGIGESDPQPGQEFKVDLFVNDRYVDIVGTAKGKGFQGVMKRHGFGGGRASHGSMFHRAPGSVGQSASPSRVFPNMRFPGQMGNHRVTKKHLEVVRIISEENLIFVRGAVPGGRNASVLITRSLKGRGQRTPDPRELAAAKEAEEAQAAQAAAAEEAPVEEVAAEEVVTEEASAEEVVTEEASAEEVVETAAEETSTEEAAEAPDNGEEG